MKKVIYLVRHGNYDYLHHKIPSHETYDFPLTERGISDMNELGNLISNSADTITSIYTSPFARTTQTSEIIASILSVSVNVNYDLVETTHEEYENKEYEKIFNRVSKTINDLLTKEGNFIVVSHRDPLSIYISKLTGKTIEEILKNKKCTHMIPMGGAYRLVFEGTEIKDIKEIYCPLRPSM